MHFLKNKKLSFYTRSAIVGLKTIGLVALLSACTNSNNSSGGGGSSVGQTITPDQIHSEDYHNRRGQLLGVWDANADIQIDGHEKFQMEVHFYINSSQTAVRAICSRHGRNFADLAGIVTSSIAQDNITFNQSLDLANGECEFKVPQATLTYSINTFGNSDTATLGSGMNEIEIRRDTPAEEPVRPDQPERPDHPDRPDHPEQPVRPDQPRDPNHPGYEQPNYPQQPTQPVLPPIPQQPNRPIDPGHDQDSSMNVFANDNCQGINVRMDNARSCEDQLRGLNEVRSVLVFGTCQQLPRAMNTHDFCNSAQRN